jgi:hypothetical protein
MHYKKSLAIFPFPSSPWPGIIKLFLARESLVSDIPAGDGKIAELFYSVPSLDKNVIPVADSAVAATGRSGRSAVV